MEQFFANFSEVHRILTYIIIFLGMFIEGEVVLILSGILVRGGSINFLNVVIFAFSAVVIHDIAYWFIGKKLSQLHKKKFLFFNLEKMESLFNKIKSREGLYIFASKFAWNTNRFVLLSSGYMKTPFKRLLRNSIPAALIWTIAFVSLGFVFADQAGILKKDLKKVAIFITILLIAVILLENVFRKIIAKSGAFYKKYNGNKEDL